MNMQVARNSVITLDYHVTDPDGDVVDEGREPLIYLHGGYEDIFPKIEEALQGKTVGESVKVKLQPDEAFGDYDAEMVQVEPRKDFPKELEVGMQFEGGPEEGEEVIDKIVAGVAREENLLLLDDLCQTMTDGSLCAMGGLTPMPVQSAVKHFPEDFDRPAKMQAAE